MWGRRIGVVFPLKNLYAVALFMWVTTPTMAQLHHQLGADDYARAAKLLPDNIAPLLIHSPGKAAWLCDGSFWYERVIEQGTDFVHIDPAHDVREPLFNQVNLAEAISAATGKKVNKNHMTLTNVRVDCDGAISFVTMSTPFRCNVTRNHCYEEELPRDSALSPDGNLAAFIRNYNLWIYNINTGEESQLTTDGEKDFGYATDNAGFEHSDRPIVRWSPDSSRIATYQQDQRGVGEMYLVETRLGHPKLDAWKYALPGDESVPTIHRVIIEVRTKRVIRLHMQPDQRRASHCFDMKCDDGQMSDVQWSEDGLELAFISMSRDHKSAKLRMANAQTGEVREVLQERAATYYESTENSPSEAVNWRYLSATHEVIWFSQRGNWGHLYLYDANSGELKSQITNGSWNVVELITVDEKRRTLYFMGAGRERGSDPYFRYFYRVGMNGKRLTLLTTEDATHNVSMSPAGNYFVDTYSRPDTPPTMVLRDSQGHLVKVLEKADISRLAAAGWRSPLSITVKARDGETDLYGLLFSPPTMDIHFKYPVVICVYPGPHLGSVGSREFGARIPQYFCNAESLAALGFVVIAIDGMGTPLRSKAFQDFYYGNMSDNTLPDQMAAVRQLAQRYPWVDLDRVGITGLSGGGYAAATALLRYPDFFKVGVAIDGNYDQRGEEGDWGENFMGLLKRNADGTSNYDSQADQNLAANLEGHLLLVHGTLDDNVPPYLALLLVKALIDANKDFDMLMLPNERHIPIPSGRAGLYVARKRWDYFVRYLLGVEPPGGVNLSVFSENEYSTP